MARRLVDPLAHDAEYIAETERFARRIETRLGVSVEEGGSLETRWRHYKRTAARVSGEDKLTEMFKAVDELRPQLPPDVARWCLPERFLDGGVS